MDRNNVDAVLKRFNPSIGANDLHLYAAALDVGAPDNERMEFLGDAVVGLVAADLLYRKYPVANEGKLSHLRTNIVRGSTLAKLCVTSGVSSLILPTSVLKMTPRILEDAMESFVGAVFLDHGFEASAAWFREVVREGLASATKESPSVADAVPHRVLVRDWCRARRKKLATSASFCESDAGFVCTVAIDGVVAAVSRKNAQRREAEDSAFAQAWDYIRMIDPSCLP